MTITYFVYSRNNPDSRELHALSFDRDGALIEKEEAGSIYCPTAIGGCGAKMKIRTGPSAPHLAHEGSSSNCHIDHGFTKRRFIQERLKDHLEHIGYRAHLEQRRDDVRSDLYVTGGSLGSKRIGIEVQVSEKLSPDEIAEIEEHLMTSFDLDHVQWIDNNDANCPSVEVDRKDNVRLQTPIDPSHTFPTVLPYTLLSEWIIDISNQSSILVRPLDQVILKNWDRDKRYQPYGLKTSSINHGTLKDHAYHYDLSIHVHKQFKDYRKDSGFFTTAQLDNPFYFQWVTSTELNLPDDITRDVRAAATVLIYTLSLKHVQHLITINSYDNNGPIDKQVVNMLVERGYATIQNDQLVATELTTSLTR